MYRTPALPQRTMRDSLRWIGWDVPFRLIPFAAISLFWAYILANWTETLKLSWNLTGLDAALILGTGIPAFVACTLFRTRYWPIQNLASPRAHLIEDGYFFFFNAPAEELFFRGMLQSWAMSARLFAAGRRLCGCCGDLRLLSSPSRISLAFPVACHRRRRFIWPPLPGVKFDTNANHRSLHCGSRALQSWTRPARSSWQDPLSCG